ncbi:MAG: DUF2911 domain-containing protein [Candidatus Acidiferrum sp.]|jgi:hypothetical protein
MKNLAILLALCALSLGVFIGVRAAQNKSSRPSPPAKASCDLGAGKTLTVEYSSPRAKGRQVFGGLVPYGEVWRAGANEATTFVTDSDLNVGGKTISAGSYTIFTIPDKDKWTLIISKKTGEWGVPYPGAESDFARIDMTSSSLPATVENFTIAFDKSGTGCTMHLDWETTRASIAIARK